ncbi:MAG: nucleotide sugar dehydrogenase [Candidatus Magasanikbacteria bacterium]|nr:nucleotide sugar dehydrogenase [Candidatus Magasanikbacteria bacterium]
MNILYIGGGFVGTCSAAVSADSGHNVLVYDIDEKKIDKLGSYQKDRIESCMFEEGLYDLLSRNKERIKFTSDYSKVKNFLDKAHVVFMCLPTPEIGETGESDLSFYFDAAEKLANTLIKRQDGKQDNYIVIVNKSTVPIDMVGKTKEIMTQAGVKKFGVVSNPEFLVEGKAVHGSVRPDRVVIGGETEKDFEIMRKLYDRFYSSSGVKYIEVGAGEAEAGKLLSNYLLFNKLTQCFDVVGRTCETFPDLKFENVRKILITDPRIGNWGLYDSLYAGGSCFIKDSRSLSYQLQTAGKNATLVNESYLANKRQLELFIGRAERELDYNWEGKKVALLGLAFKQDTNDIRNAPSINIVNFLLENRVEEIKCYDPVANGDFKRLFEQSKEVKYFETALEALQDTDAVIIATDWPQFRGLYDSLVGLYRGKKGLIMDGRRMLQHKYNDLSREGFDIIAVGSPLLKAK